MASSAPGNFYLQVVGLFYPLLLCYSSMTANKDLEDKLQEMNAASDKSVVDLKERIQVLEKELHNANELLSSSKLRGLFFLTPVNMFSNICQVVSCFLHVL